MKMDDEKLAKLDHVVETKKITVVPTDEFDTVIMISATRRCNPFPSQNEFFVSFLVTSCRDGGCSTMAAIDTA